MLVPLKNMAGQIIGEVDLNDSIYATPVNVSLMHQALVRQLANARLGTHDTKTRSEVAGGGRKPWRQKGTGRARQGSTRAPNWVGGGVVFGPTPRKYTKSLNKKMQRSALRSALSAKASEGHIVVVDGLSLEAPKTKAMVAMLKALGMADQNVLLVMADKDQNIARSASNLPNVKTLLSNYLNVRDLLGHDVVVLTHSALPQIDQWLAVNVTVEAEQAELMEVEDAETEPVAGEAETTPGEEE
jgi:large subunit ribosomal protein L4